MQRRTHLLIVALYAVLAVALTWPLARHLGTHVQGSYTWAFDEYTFVWNTWWFRYALFDLGQNPLYSTHTFYPLGISLVLYTYNLFNVLISVLISVPLQPFLSLPAISNLTFLFATVLSGYGTFLLVKYLLSNIQYPIHKNKGTHRYWIFDIGPRFWPASSTPLAPIVLSTPPSATMTCGAPSGSPSTPSFWSRRSASRACVTPCWPGSFLALAMLCEMIFGVFLAMLTLVVLAFVLGRRARSSVAGGWRSLLGRLVVVGLVALLIYGPVLVPVLGEMFGGYELAGWGDAEKLSVDLAGLVTPTALHPLGGDWQTTLRQTREGTARFRDVNTVFVGWAGLALALVGAVRYRAAADFVSFYDLRYVVVAPGVPGRPPYVDTRDEAVAYVEEVLPVEKVYDEHDWLLYRVDQPSRVEAVTVDVGSGQLLPTMALGAGWSGAEELRGASARWAVAQGAEAFLPAAEAGRYRLTLTALPFDYPDAAPQALTPEVNGRRPGPGRRLAARRPRPAHAGRRRGRPDLGASPLRGSF